MAIRIRKRGNREYVSIILKQDGKRSELGLGWVDEGWTREKAQAHLDKLKAPKKVRQQRPPQSSPTQSSPQLCFRDIAEKWIDFSSTYKSSWHEEKLRLNKHVLPAFGHMNLDQINPGLLEDWMTSKKTTLSQASVIQCFGIIRGVYAFALRRQLWTGTPPTKLVKLQSLNNGRSRFLTKEQIEMLIKEAPHAELADIITVLAFTGMRRSEALKLTWQDVDLENNRIHLLDTKNHHQRIVHLNQMVVDTLQRRRRLQSGSEDKVFTWSQDRVTRAFKRLMDRLGWNEHAKDNRRKLVLHSLRHSFCSMLAENGATLQTIQQLAGHECIQSTLRYAHLGDEVLKAAIASL